MAPEWGAYPVSNHAGVACTECHIAPGIPGFVHAKVNGTKQLLMVVANKYPRDYGWRQTPPGERYLSELPQPW